MKRDFNEFMAYLDRNKQVFTPEKSAVELFKELKFHHFKRIEFLNDKETLRYSAPVHLIKKKYPFLKVKGMLLIDKYEEFYLTDEMMHRLLSE